jgi:hypothetical protein
MASCQPLRHFVHLKMLSFTGHESLGSRVFCFRCVTLRHSCLPLRHFGHLMFLKSLESHGSGVSCFRWLTLRHFEGLKILFLKCPDTSVSGDLRNRIFRPSKCRSVNQRKEDTPDQGNVTTVGPYWTLWCPENASPVELWDPEYKVTKLPLETFIAFWRP